jgi:hypothetical protein
VATRLESRKSLLGGESGFGHYGGGHSYNQAYGDGDFHPHEAYSPQDVSPQQPSYAQPMYDDAGVSRGYDQGYAYREGISQSTPAPSTHHSNFGFMKSKWPAAFMAISAIQAVLCICFEAYVVPGLSSKHSVLTRLQIRFCKVPG